MPYKVLYSNFDGIFAVPNTVVEKYLKVCSPTALKVILLLLHDTKKAGEIDSISEQLGITTADTVEALNYWVQAGMLQMTSGVRNVPKEEAKVTPQPICEEQPQNKEKAQKVMTVSSRPPRISQQEMAQLARTDENISVLISEMQSAMGKALSPMESEIIVSLYTYAGVPVDYILLTAVYCSELGKNNVRYLEKTIYSWLEQGIDTYEKAEQHIIRIGESGGRENMVKSAFGIFDRALSAQEKKFVQSWYDELGYELPMIALAYNKTIDSIGKLSFPYINTILRNWHAKGFKTVQQAQEENKPAAAQYSAERSAASSSDLDELEQLITHGRR
ncbi:MAG: DnaD domain protein [Oscillospiraceae bacterium]|nr:DnaD domain protein [Oscillospiraceae bacterium]